MGTRHLPSRVSKRSHAVATNDERHQNRRAKVRAARKNNSILRDKLPKAGMIYPFQKTLLRRHRSDVAVATAIKRGTGAPLLTRDLLDDGFHRVFKVATQLLRLQQRDRNNYEFRDNPIALMATVREQPGIREIWGLRTVNMLASVFIVLRAARQNWHKTPRFPFDTAEHSKAAQAIDDFLAVDNLDWGSLAFVEWLLRGGREIMEHAGNHDMMDEGGDWDDETRLFAKQTCPVPMEGIIREEVDGNISFHLSFEAVMEGMRRLNIDVQQDVLIEAFGKLCIEDRALPTPRMDSPRACLEGSEEQVMDIARGIL
ncbi:hypothetical protein C8A01DRAFT_18670 [Parachaetomium inaequale]|uniref:Uncharacterized protein n=1 Tax=Parachaetomium inaequale TaxID=2588326 RepID=A0AAN6SPB1_9PEZI|nr:hypothetical protein C8A01DRAFT_18670 [Parachaetomium inaequale]